MFFMKWITEEKNRQIDSEKKLKERLGLPEYIIKAMINRGIDSPEKAEEMFNSEKIPLHSPFLFEQMDKAAERILSAVNKKEKITIYGDYDVDGVTAITILYLFLRDYLNAGNVEFYIPGRHDEGYGMNRDAAAGIVKGGTKLIITVDCGITSKDDVEFCVENGVDVIVTDHHMPGERTIPDKAFAILNPKYSENYPDKELSGAGVAYKLVCALGEKNGIVLGDDFLDFAALGTIADIVPLTPENRIIAVRGMRKMASPSNLGIRALKEAAGMKEGAVVSTFHMGFVLGPRINAAGRLEHAKKAVELFIGSDIEKIREAALGLNRINEERKAEAKKTGEQALEKLKGNFDPEKDFVIVLYDKNWNPGIVGLTASKILEKFDRPVFVMTMGEDGFVHGSARSVPTVNIYECLKAVDGIPERYGGHKLAAGVSIKEERIDEFREKINEYIKKNHTAEGFEKRINIE
ncbi:MAG TPA: single-stranded-DNA-specific exonuclease RecJ, partial [Firmicutes bacterium]|nr:single-stranded-DNA-specific exonuclease RecJ [Bacillota bacterium]